MSKRDQVEGEVGHTGPFAVSRRTAVMGPLSAALGATLPTNFGYAADEYPSRPVRALVAGAPGGNPDVLMRLIGQEASKELGQPVLVEDIPGSNGVVAVQRALAAPSDGYTLIVGDSSMLAINPALFAHLPYDPLRDFSEVTALASVPTILVVRSTLGPKTLQDFIAFVRSQPGRVNYGSGGPGSIQHLTMAVFAREMNLEMVHVPYRGGSALVNGLLTGEIQAGWSGIPTVKSLIEQGTLVPLAISTARRSASMPDVPTASEQGVKGFDYATTLGAVVRSGTPPTIISKLQSVISRAIRVPLVTTRMATLGMDLAENGTAKYQMLMRRESEQYGKLIQTLKLKID